MRGRGVGWTRETEAGGNNYVSTQLVYRDKTDLILSRLLPPPRNTSLLCVQFKYKKYSLGRKRKMWCRARDIICLFPSSWSQELPGSPGLAVQREPGQDFRLPRLSGSLSLDVGCDHFPQCGELFRPHLQDWRTRN